ncbi:MAG: nicotinamide mononucleotide transporter, partial [Bacteroidetes bacterium]|nr:nicotinamide mononucleotide transporter [Bacteroidota bacterium]
MDSVLRFLEMSHWAELPATAFALIFLWLLLKEKALAWPFGIASSALFVYIFLDAKLFMEAYLYGFYVLAGLYGWWHWSFGKKLENHKLQILEWKRRYHIWAVLLSAALSILLGYELTELRPDASLPYFDSFTTIFALLATYMQSRKILSSWI